MGVVFASPPSEVVVEPGGEFQIGLLTQRLPIGVGEEKGAVGLLNDAQKAVVGVSVTGLAYTRGVL